MTHSGIPYDPSRGGRLPVGAEGKKRRLPPKDMDIVSKLADHKNPQGAV